MGHEKRELDESLKYSTFCMRRIGISFENPKSRAEYWRLRALIILCVSSIGYHIFGEIIHTAITLSNSPRIEDVVPNFHIFGYGILSFAKVLVIWSKKDVCGQLIDALALDDGQSGKDNKITTMRVAHLWYFGINILGIWLYNLTPIGIYYFHKWQGHETNVGFVWVSWYPFDKHQPIAHVFVYIFEMFIGQICLWIVIGTDMLFSGIASHICRLLRELQQRLETLASSQLTDDEYYLKLVENIKMHQRLIRYCNDLEYIFTVSNLANIILSCVNICCVLFVIVLIEPTWAVPSKMYLGSALVQIGVLCWYGDDILHANGDVAASAYNSGWQRMNTRCRRTLLFLLVRSQKPIAFTAMNFTNISLVTYGSILTKSYSFFALLYTVYRDH